MNFVEIYERILAAAERNSELPPDVLRDLQSSSTLKQWIILNNQGASPKAYLEVGELMRRTLNADGAHRWFRRAWQTWNTEECGYQYVDSCIDRGLNRTAARVLTALAEDHRMRGEMDKLRWALEVLSNVLRLEGGARRVRAGTRRSYGT